MEENNGNSNAYIFPGSLVNDQYFRSVPNNAMMIACSTTNLNNHSDQPQSQGSSSHVIVDDGNYIDPYFLTLPIGIRFCPNDRELVVEYLMKKVRNEALPKNRIHEVNIYECHPAILTEKYKRYAEFHWYFFTTRDKRYPKGTRPNRAVPGGFWKPTGSSKACVFDDNNNPIASKTPLDFYEEKGKDNRTEWKMLEYFPTSMDIPSSSAGGMRLNDCVLSVIYRKGEKPNGAVTVNHGPVNLRIDASTSSHNNSPQPANHAGSTAVPREVYFNGYQNTIQDCYGNSMFQGDYGYNINQAFYGNNMNQNVASTEPAMLWMMNANEGTSRGCSNHVAFAGPSSSMPPIMRVARLNGHSSSKPPTMHVSGLNGPSSSTLPINPTMHVAGLNGPISSMPPIMHVAGLKGPISSMPPTMHVAGLNGPSSSLLPRNPTVHVGGSNGPSSSMLPRNNMEGNDNPVEPNNATPSNHQESNDDLLNSLPDSAFDDAARKRIDKLHWDSFNSKREE